MTGAGGRQEVASMAWPLAVGMLSFTVMGLTDTLLMGRVGTSAQAGVGLGAVIAMTAAAFFRGLTSGPQSLISAADGAGDRARVEEAGGAAVGLGLLSGLVVSLGLWIFLALCLDWLANDPEVAEASHAYLDWRLIGLPVSMLAFGLMASLQGLGDTRSRMWASLAGNALNIVLDLVLIFGWGPFPQMGAAGAGLATMASGALMALIYAWRYFQLYGWPRLPTAEVLRSALNLGLPAGMQALLGMGSFAAMSVALAKAGPAHLAASQIVINIISVSFLPGYGVSEAGGVLVGRYLGAGRRATAVRTVRSARWLAVLAMGVCGTAFALGGGAITGLFTEDPEVARIGATLMIFAAVFQVFDAVAMTHLSALRNAGDTRFTLLVTSVTAWGLTVPFAVGFGVWLGWGAPGAWFGMTLEIALLALITAWRVRGLEDGRIGRMDLLLGKQPA